MNCEIDLNNSAHQVLVPHTNGKNKFVRIINEMRWLKITSRAYCILGYGSIETSLLFYSSFRFVSSCAFGEFPSWVPYDNIQISNIDSSDLLYLNPNETHGTFTTCFCKRMHVRCAPCEIDNAERS